MSTPFTRKRGQAAILVTLSMPVLLGLIGLVVDIGWAYWRQEACLTAAQSAALGGIFAAKTIGTSAGGYTCGTATNQVPCGTDTTCPSSLTTASNPIQAGCLYAKQNGFIQGSNRQQVYVTSGNTGAFSGITPSYWMTYTATEQIPQMFSAVFGNKMTTVSASATAGIIAPNSGSCIYSLDTNAANIGVKFSGNPNIHASCGIYANDPGTAMTIGGSTIVNASTIKLVGTYTVNGGPTLNPTPLINQSAVLDPFSGVAPVSAPVGHGCDTTTGIPTTVHMPADGYYVVCGGGFSMNGGPTVNLPAGIYIMKAGSINLQNGHLNGTGVTFYLTGTFSGISINGNVAMNLTAPTSGPTDGLLFYQDRSLAVGAFSSTINGGSNSFLIGSLYFPTTNLSYSGGSSTTSSFTALVAWDITFVGDSYFAADPNGAHTGLNVARTGLIQ